MKYIVQNRLNYNKATFLDTLDQVAEVTRTEVAIMSEDIVSDGMFQNGIYRVIPVEATLTNLVSPPPVIDTYIRSLNPRQARNLVFTLVAIAPELYGESQDIIVQIANLVRSVIKE